MSVDGGGRGRRDLVARDSRVIGRHGHGRRRQVDGIAALAFRVLAGHRCTDGRGQQQPRGREHDGLCARGYYHWPGTEAIDDHIPTVVSFFSLVVIVVV